ncbi:MAG: DUF1552 domain-containing protein [Planctomycetota bacterium]|nr:MAG: DUF1552 domain-containing protein [Planctomycetota bacterium]
MINRRQMLQAVATATGSTWGASLLPQHLLAASPHPPGPGNTTPKRIVFFLQNQGFDPHTCIPDGMTSSGSLAKAKLPEPIQALEPYKERLHIINGLHGTHTSPTHSAFFGALGGYRGGDGVPPSAATIDYELSQRLPPTLLPHLCIGMDSMENMTAKPTIATLSASGPGQPIFMHSNPNHLYQMLFGGIATGDIRRQHEARSNVMGQIQRLAAAKGRALPETDQRRYDQFVQGFRDVNDLRLRLDAVADHLREFAPPVDDRYSQPRFETDWHDCLLELGIAALTSGITNTLTIGSGRGEIFGAWKGLGIEEQGHGLGHMDQPGNPIWIKIRQYNTRMLVRIMEALDSVPEGSGTMMDHTLIVYTSNNADKQHTDGANWPVMLLGNFDGAIKTGCFTQLDGRRPINALYTALLRIAGDDANRFNMSEQLARKFDDATGPLKEVLT